MLAELQRSRRLRLDDVRIFAALMREGSLLAAARRLGVDDSTVSRRLAAFEASLELRLFDRTREGLRPLASAERLFVEAERVEEALAGLAREAGSLERAPEGTVRLTAPPLLSELLLVPALGRVARLYPGIRIELDASTRLAQLTRREADIALRPSRPEGGDLILRQVLTLAFAPLAAPDYVAGFARPVEAWGDLRWIGWDLEMDHLPVARWLAERLGGRPPWFRANAQPAQLAAVEAGLGCALLAEPVGQVRGLARVPLAPALARDAATLPHEAVWLVGHRALRDVPRIRAVWDALVEEIPRMMRELSAPAAAR